MRWQLRRGLLNPTDAPTPGSPWWRAINERLLYDGSEARALAFGHSGPPSSPTAAAWLEFIRRPSAGRWYRAHNMSVVGGYLEHEHLASEDAGAAAAVSPEDEAVLADDPDLVSGHDLHGRRPRAFARAQELTGNGAGQPSGRPDSGRREPANIPRSFVTPL